MKSLIKIVLFVFILTTVFSCSAKKDVLKPFTALIIGKKPAPEVTEKKEEPVMKPAEEPTFKVEEPEVETGIQMPEEAEITERAVEEPIRDEQFYYAQGLDFDSRGMYREAQEAYQEVINLNPDNIDAQYKLGMSFLRTGDRASAFQTYRVLVEMDPQRAEEFYQEVLKETSERPDNNFVVQAGAFRIPDNALKLLKMLRTSFLNAYIEEENGLQKVRILGIRSKDEGSRIKDEIFRKFGIVTFMKRVR